MMSTGDTIVAIATPPGRGGVGIVRLSGPNALTITRQIAGFPAPKPRRVSVRSFRGTDGEVIDEGILLTFQAPHSFTGEDVAELQCHGAPVVLDMLLHTCVEYGARIARPGEFSERAFLNDKMDLTQAEAIADLIDANSRVAARMALRSLSGAFSQAIHQLDDQIVWLRTYVEASLDFPEEEIDFLGDGKVATHLDAIMETLLQVQSRAVQGALMREGITVVIAGHPNAGKSTLINRLAGRDVAIVTDIAGTTRDILREAVILRGITLHLVDTAGLRESNDVVEQEGIRRAWEQVRTADLVLHVFDNPAAEHLEFLDTAIRDALPPGVRVIPVCNKADTRDDVQGIPSGALSISAKTGEGIEVLCEAILADVGFYPEEGQFLARRRHLDAIARARTCLESGIRTLHALRAGELLAEDLRMAHEALGEITGVCTADDLLGKIFAGFCIGK